MSTATLRKPLLAVALATALLLLVPAIAMQFTSEVAWGPGDFVVAAVLLFGAGVTTILGIRQLSRETSGSGLAFCLAETSGPGQASCFDSYNSADPRHLAKGKARTLLCVYRMRRVGYSHRGLSRHKRMPMSSAHLAPDSDARHESNARRYPRFRPRVAGAILMLHTEAT